MSYDERLRFKRLTPQNWREPDVPTYAFTVNETQWADAFLTPQLRPEVPVEIVRLFEIARGCMVQAWHFYPLLTLGAQQLTRVLEAAVKAKCRALRCEREDFAGNLKALSEEGVIREDELTCWDAGRRLRNEYAHLDAEKPSLHDPGTAHGLLRQSADRINSLFQAADPNFA